MIMRLLVLHMRRACAETAHFQISLITKQTPGCSHESLLPPFAWLPSSPHALCRQRWTPLTSLPSWARGTRLQITLSSARSTSKVLISVCLCDTRSYMPQDSSAPAPTTLSTPMPLSRSTTPDTWYCDHLFFKISLVFSYHALEPVWHSCRFHCHRPCSPGPGRQAPSLLLRPILRPILGD